MYKHSCRACSRTPRPVRQVPKLLYSLIIYYQSTATRHTTKSLLQTIQVRTLKSNVTLLNLRHTGAVIRHFRLNLNRRRTATQVGLNSRYILIIHKLVTLKLSRHTARLNRQRLLKTITRNSTMRQGKKTNNSTLSVTFLAVRHLRSTAMFTFTSRMSTIRQDTTPSNVLNLQISPRQFLQRIGTNFLRITRRTSNNAELTIGLLMTSYVHTTNRRRNNRRGTRRSNNSRNRSPNRPNPLNGRASSSRRSCERRRDANLGPQRNLIFLDHMLMSLSSLLSYTLLLQLHILFHRRFFLY